jgi:hypothetical protein
MAIVQRLPLMIHVLCELPIVTLMFHFSASFSTLQIHILFSSNSLIMCSYFYGIFTIILDGCKSTVKMHK